MKRKSTKGGHGGSHEANRLVPWNAQTLMTDAQRLSALTDSTYRCRRSYAGPSFSQTATDQEFSLVAQLSLVQDVAYLAGVFDQYRIAKVEVNFRPQSNVETATGIMGRLVTVVDLDDSVTPGGLNILLDYSNAIDSTTKQAQRRCFVPSVAGAVYGNNAGTFSGYSNLSAPWLDCASQNIPHYGVKYGISMYNTTTTIDAYTITVTLELEFKASR